jgi:hypothetical protein
MAVLRAQLSFVEMRKWGRGSVRIPFSVRIRWRQGVLTTASLYHFFSFLRFDFPHIESIHTWKSNSPTPICFTTLPPGDGMGWGMSGSQNGADGGRKASSWLWIGIIASHIWHSVKLITAGSWSTSFQWRYFNKRHFVLMRDQIQHLEGKSGFRIVSGATSVIRLTADKAVPVYRHHNIKTYGEWKFRSTHS